MTRPFLLILGLGLAGTLLSAQQPKDSSIKGVVFDAVTKKPLSDVAVEGPVPDGISIEDLATGRVPIPRAITDKDGAYSFEGLPSGRKALTFNKSMYRSLSVPFNLGANQSLDGFDVSLTPLGIISGRLATPSGEPAINISITPFRYLPDSADRELVFITTAARTDDRGEFRLPGLLPGNYYLSFASEVRQSGSDTGIVARPPGWIPPTPMNPMLYPGAGDLAHAEEVIVKEGEETRLRDVVIGRAQLGDIRIGITNGTGTAVRDVQFSLSYLSRGISFVQSGWQGGQYPAWESIKLEGGSEAKKTYQPSRVGLFVADVIWRDPEGQILRQRTPIHFEGQDVEQRLVLTKPDGQIQIHAVRRQPDGSLVPLTGGTIGLCQGNNSICSRSEFWLSNLPTNARGPGDQKLLTFDSAGNARLSGVAKGEYQIYSITPRTTVIGSPDWYVGSALQDGRNALTDGVTVSEKPSVVEVILGSNPAKIDGIVIDPQGRKVQQAFVVLIPDPPLDQSKLTSLRKTIRTDQEGGFQIDGIAPGKYHLFAIRSVPEVRTEKTFIENLRANAMPVTIGTDNLASFKLQILD